MIEVLHLSMSGEAHASQETVQMYVKLHFRVDLDAIRAVLADAETWAKKGLTYRKVADVATDDLDVAFEKTNHIDRSWTENAGVTLHGPVRVRSTSVGDLMVSNGKTFVVASIGFEQVLEGVPA